MRRALLALWVALWLAPWVHAQGDAGDKRPKPPAAAEAKDDDAEAKIKDILKNKRVTFDFVETPIVDAMNFVQALIGANLVIDPGMDQQAPLTLRVNEMPVGQALQWMAKMVGAKMDVRDGAIVIQAAKDDEREFGPKLKLEKGPPLRLVELVERLKRPAGRTLGKATIPLGNGIVVELNIEEEDLDPEMRRVLLRVLYNQLLADLEKRDPKAAQEFREAVERRARMEAEERARRAAEEARPKPLIKKEKHEGHGPEPRTQF